MPIVIMLVSAFAIIGLVKYGLVPGIDRASASLGWSLKARGKATGYATSVPELVTLVAAGLSGVWEAGLWNIASSNIINVSLATAALLVYRRGRDLLDRRFVKELSFAGLGIIAPLLLMQLQLDQHPSVVIVLLLCFGLSLVDASDGKCRKTNTVKTMDRWVLCSCAFLLGLIALLGTFGVCNSGCGSTMGVPAIAAGWILVL